MNPSSSISRRTQVLVTAICLLAAAYAQAKNRPPAASEQQLFIGEGIAEADTEYGPVRGFLLRNIYSFRGIPYGDDTGGENRFMPPQPPHAWQEIRPAVAFGASSPQPFYDRRPESYSMFVDHWNYDLMGEDCLRLNIWTPALPTANAVRYWYGSTAGVSRRVTASNRTATTGRISPATATLCSAR